MGFNLSLDAWQTSLEAAKANTLASSTVMAAHLNEELKNRYLSAFDSWKTMVLAGKIPNNKPPMPPVGYDVVASENGFAYPELGTKAVCELPELPSDFSQPNVPVLPEPDHVRNVPKGDTMPVGSIVTAEDGTRWQKQSSVTPFGVAYYYARVS